MNKRSLVAASAAAALGLLIPATPSLAKPATTGVDWRLEADRGDPTSVRCLDPKVVSDKDISNIVYVLADGQTVQIEFPDDAQPNEHVVDGEVVQIWVKSGNNNSNRGLGDEFIPVPNVNCLPGGGGPGGT